ncbi:hypothetical protein SAMN04488510_1457 [Fervidobacterium changbaicum]|nr:hypothetical protein SAMN04488510_1457 [Fervidobacterium changbaicum]
MEGSLELLRIPSPLADWECQDKVVGVKGMTIAGVNSVLGPVYPPTVARPATVASATDVAQQVQQAKELMLRTLEFAFYKQQDMNLKLVRIAGELFQGKNLDVTV